MNKEMGDITLVLAYARGDLTDTTRRAYVENLVESSPTWNARFRAIVSAQTNATDASIRSRIQELGKNGELQPEYVDEYRIVRRLGEGGMGVVFLAADTILKRQVAVKVLAGHLTGSAQALARFRDEARSAAALNHPAIVPVYKFGFDGSHHYIVTEYVDGPTLAQEILEETQRRQNLTSTEDARAWRRRCAETVSVIADALDCSHRAGIVHRDVKPSNILLDSVRGPRLTDFGIAKHFTDDARTGVSVVVGSCHYMSPEQASIAGTLVDQRSDVFSLGVVLYEMLVCRRPFDGTDLHQVLSAVIAAEPRSLRSIDRRIPTDLETICRKAMEKSPTHRYQTAAHMAADLRCFLAGEPILARSPSPARRVRRLLKNPVVRWALTAAACGALFVSAYAWGLGRRTKSNDQGSVEWAQSRFISGTARLYADAEQWVRLREALALPEREVSGEGPLVATGHVAIVTGTESLPTIMGTGYVCPVSLTQDGYGSRIPVYIASRNRELASDHEYVSKEIEITFFGRYATVSFSADLQIRADRVCILLLTRDDMALRLEVTPTDIGAHEHE